MGNNQIKTESNLYDVETENNEIQNVCDICGDLIESPEIMDIIDVAVNPSEDIVATPNIQPQVPGFPSLPEIILHPICNDFVGVYLPIDYINRLFNTGNHSYSMHLNESYDVLAVFDNRIFSNLKWHDQWAIRPSEGNLFRFHKIMETFVIIDDKGCLYIKIGIEPSLYYRTVETFVAEIIFDKLKKQNIGVSLVNRMVTLPFLYPYIGEDSFFIRLGDTFFERGINLLLSSVRDRNITIGLKIEENSYNFYDFIRLDNDGEYIFCEITNSQNWIWYRMGNKIYTYQINTATE